MKFKTTHSLLISGILAILLCLDVAAQSQRARNWAFPMGNGLEFTSTGVDTFDVSVAVGNPFLNRGTSAISDEDGNLLFYSNGIIAWDSTHNVMLGGDNLVGSKACTQSSIIIPWPLSPDRYFLFVQDSLAAPNGLHHYMVDMSLNGGLGQVFPGPTQILDTATEKLCATQHANDRDFWVVAHKWNSNEFHAFLVDQNGVNNTPVISAVGSMHDGTVNGTQSQMKISPDGRKLALSSFAIGFVELFDFDPATGVVSNPIVLETGAINLPHGVEFSADSKKLYYGQKFSASPAAELFQYDLEHTSVDCLIASKTSVGVPNPIKIMGDLQLGLDKKIYLTYELPLSTNDTLGVINEPSLKGLDCDFEESTGPVISGSRVTVGLTNFVSTFLSDGIYYEFGTNCSGDSTVFWPEDTLGVDSVAWDFGDPASGNNTATGIPARHLFSSADTFLVTLYRYENGVVDTFQRDVVVWDVDLQLLGNDTTVCAGQTIDLDATWNDACIEWSTGSTNEMITVNTEGTYWVDVFYQSCAFRDSVEVVTVAGPPIVDLGSDTAVCSGVNFTIDPDLQNAFYTWQDGSNDTTFAVTATGTYWLEASNACGTASDTLEVELDLAAQPSLTFPDDTTVCDSVPFVVDVTFDLAVYEWSDGDNNPIKTITTPGEYWVRVSNSCDTVSDTMDVVIQSPYLSALEESYLLCSETEVIDLPGVSNGEPVSWSTGATVDTLQTSNAGEVWFTTNNICGTLSDTTSLIDWDLNYAFTIGADTTLCQEGETFTIDYVDSVFSFDYVWSTGATTSEILVNNEGVYTLSITNRCETLTSSRSVSLATPLALDELRENNVCEGESILIEGPVDAERFAWSTGVSDTEIEVNSAGLYLVTITDSAGCSFEDSVRIVSICEVQVFVPNVFSANGDGINDQFCAEYKNVRTAQVQIFNRWGQLVYESDDLLKCWDGTNVSEAVPEGTYYYVIEGEGTDGESFSQRSFITLLR